MTQLKASITLVIFVVFAFATAAGCSGGSGNPSPGTGGAAGTGTGGSAGSSGGSAGTTGAGGTGGATGAAGALGLAGTMDQGVGGSSGSGGTAGAAGRGGNGGTAGAGGSSGGRGGATGGTSGGGSGGSAGSGGATGGSGGGSARWTCPPGSFTGITIPNGSAATKINNAPPPSDLNNQGNNFTNVEGPVWIGDALYFSEMQSSPNPPKAWIYKIDASDNVTRAFPSVDDSGSNGLAVDGDGNLVAACHGIGGLVRYALPGGAMTTIISSYMNKRFDSPNDLTIRDDGTIFFTDPNFQAPSTLPQSATRVYMVPPGSSTAMVLVDNASNPNGITLSLDQQTLYIGDGGGVTKYAVNANGTIVTPGTRIDPTDLNNNATDGMAIDCAGNLYVTRVNQHDVIVVSSAGQKVGQMTIPGAGQLTNIAFGGTEHKTLYVTSQGTGSSGRGVFKVTMPLPGMPY
jgi:gluconolactonase